MGIVMLAYSNPVDDDHDDEFTNWYDKTHIPQVRAAVPGVTAVRRYRAVPAPQAPPHRYVAVYEIDAQSAEEVLGALGAAAASGAIEPGAAMDPAALLAFYEPL